MFEGVVFWSIDVSVKDNCNVFGFYLLEELIFLFDHEGSVEAEMEHEDRYEKGMI